MKILSVAVSSICFLVILSCSNSKTEEKQVSLDARTLEKLKPADAALAEKYKRSCMLCHSNPDAKAPLVSDKTAWGKLINEKGIPKLIENINKGINTMPPKGQCADCTDEDYKALISFMSEGK